MSNLSYILKALLRRGPGFILLYLKESLAFDLVHGTNTHLRVPKTQTAADLQHQDGVLYVASLTNVVRRTLAQTENILGKPAFRDAQFFDLGCGKGKALLIYSMSHGGNAKHPAVGIEYDQGLCEIAQRNIANLKRAHGRAEVHCDSALNIERYIRSKTLVVYLYNPFRGETLRTVLSTIAKYPHVLIYVDPEEKRILAEYGYKIHTCIRGKHHADTWLIAMNDGNPESPSPAVDAGTS